MKFAGSLLNRQNPRRSPTTGCSGRRFTPPPNRSVSPRGGCTFAKSTRNLRERGFDFEFATLIFEGPTLERDDTRRDYGERRVLAIELAQDIALTVAYTDRAETGGEVVRRIISARQSDRNERQAYAVRVSLEISIATPGVYTVLCRFASATGTILFGESATFPTSSLPSRNKESSLIVSSRLELALPAHRHAKRPDSSRLWYRHRPVPS